MRDKLAEKGDEEQGDGVEGAGGSPESESDRDKELTQRCLKLLMQGRTPNTPTTPKVTRYNTSPNAHCNIYTTNVTIITI